MDEEKYIGTLSSGYHYEIDKANFDDWELLKLLNRYGKGELQVIIELVPMLLGGEEEAEKFLEGAKENGKIRISKAALLLNELFEQAKDLKNS